MRLCVRWRLLPNHDPVAPIPATTLASLRGGGCGPHAHILADAGVATESDGGNNAGLPFFEDNFNGALNTLPDNTKWTYDIGNGDWGGNQQLEYNTNNPQTYRWTVKAT